MGDFGKKEEAVFAGGCFWCTEAVFKMLKGVHSVSPGYARGTKDALGKVPTYEDVSRGDSGYAEAVKITYDSKEISFNDLLTVFFGSHDPTTLNRQGNDTGEQYRSAIFFTSPTQRNEAEKLINEINVSNSLGTNVVTDVEPLGKFYEAEDYHKNYFKNHPENPYCELVINPKLEKVSKKFAELLKKKQ